MRRAKVVIPVNKQVFYSLVIDTKTYNVTGRKRTKAGYVSICIKGHPNADINGYVFEHRVMMEISIGRYLTNKEVVHHKNSIKHDNRLENLEIMSMGQHTITHNLGKKRSVETRMKISEKTKIRFADKKNHPFYKHIDKNELMELIKIHGPTITAQKLGVTRRTIYNKLQEFNLMEWYKNDE